MYFLSPGYALGLEARMNIIFIHFSLQEFLSLALSSHSTEQAYVGHHLVAKSFFSFLYFSEILQGCCRLDPGGMFPLFVMPIGTVH